MKFQTKDHHPALRLETLAIMLEALREIAEDGTLTAVRCRGIAVAALADAGYQPEDARQRLRESAIKLEAMSREIAQLRMEIYRELNGGSSE